MDHPWKGLVWILSVLQQLWVAGLGFYFSKQKRADRAVHAYVMRDKRHQLVHSRGHGSSIAGGTAQNMGGKRTRRPGGNLGFRV